VNKSKRQSHENHRGSPKGVRSHRITIVICVFLIAITLAVFGQTLTHDFVNFDDDLYVYKSPAIRAGLTVKGLALAFTSPHARNWHPLTTISHMLDCQLYGLKPGGHHATNVLLHAIAVLLLFLVLWQMTGAVWKSATVAALFAVHPLHVESVAWVSERKDVLSAVFLLLMLWAYISYTRARSVTRYLAVAVLLVAGLMSKPMLVSAPVVLLLLDYWPLRRFERLSLTKEKAKAAESGDQWRVRRDLFLEKVPLVAIAAGSCVITFILQKRTTGAIPPLPFLWRIENAVVTYVIYVWETLWPTRLAVFYPHPNDTLTIWEILLAIGLLLAMTIAAIVFQRKRPYLFVGWFWYVGMLLPVIGLVQVGEQGHADRYTYLPHIGLFVLAVWLVADVAAASQRRSRIAVASAVLIIVALAWAAFIQTSYWRNSETLWTHALAVTSNNDVAHNNLGYLCADGGELDKAISHFGTALRIRSSKLDPHYSVGSAFVQVNLANALSRKGQPDEAIVHYDEAIKSQPNYADAYYNRGNTLFAEGRIDEAMADWEKTLQIRPDDADAHTCLGNALLRVGSFKEAVAQYESAIALAPEDPHSRINMAWVLSTAPDASIRDGIKAVDFAQQAMERSDSNDPKFLQTLAAAYAESGRFSEAITTAEQAMMTATVQGKGGLAHVLYGEIELYRANVPLRAAKSSD
jgi:tetratricopeptide (TPR) repeat protein